MVNWKISSGLLLMEGNLFKKLANIFYLLFKII